MKEYVMSVVAVSILAALASFVCYGSGAERTVKGAISIILIYTVCLPVVNMVADLSVEDFSFDVDDDIYAGSPEYLTVAENAFADGVRKFICAEFNLNEEDVTVEIEGFDFQKMKAEQVFVLLSGRAALSDSRRIGQKVTDSGLGECEVNIKIA